MNEEENKTFTIPKTATFEITTRLLSGEKTITRSRRVALNTCRSCFMNPLFGRKRKYCCADCARKGRNRNQLLRRQAENLLINLRGKYE